MVAKYHGSHFEKANIKTPKHMNKKNKFKFRLHTKDNRYGIIRGKRHIKIQIGNFRIYFSLTSMKPKYPSISRNSFRRQILERQPTCECCGRPLDIKTLSIHHIIPVSQRPDLVYDSQNCMSLCKNCHIQLHRTQDKAKSSSPLIPIAV